MVLVPSAGSREALCASWSSSRTSSSSGEMDLDRSTKVEQVLRQIELDARSVSTGTLLDCLIHGLGRGSRLRMKSISSAIV